MSLPRCIFALASIIPGVYFGSGVFMLQDHL
jgi:hypothetical protein